MKLDQYEKWLDRIYSLSGTFEIFTNACLGDEEPLKVTIELFEDLRNESLYRARVLRRDCYRIKHSFTEELADEALLVEDVFFWDEEQIIEATSVENALTQVLAQVDARLSN